MLGWLQGNGVCLPNQFILPLWLVEGFFVGSTFSACVFLFAAIIYGTATIPEPSTGFKVLKVRAWGVRVRDYEFRKTYWVSLSVRPLKEEHILEKVRQVRGEITNDQAAKKLKGKTIITEVAEPRATDVSEIQ